MRQRHARMQHDVRDRLGGVVPSEILEVDEDKPAVRPPESVVEAEVRRAERLQPPGERLGKGDSRGCAGRAETFGRRICRWGQGSNHELSYPARRRDDL